MALRDDRDDLIAYLNSLLELDPALMNALFRVRLICNQALAEHPTVQVGRMENAPEVLQVGLLGLLNGYVGAFDEGDKKGWGGIVALYDGERLVAFRRTEGGARQ